MGRRAESHSADRRAFILGLLLRQKTFDYPLDGMFGQPFRILAKGDHKRAALHLFDYW